MRRGPGLGSALALLREPVPREKKELMAARWETLPDTLRTSSQGFGRQATGCGATIGVMPRCDFACTGCYLGDEANRIRPLELPAVLAQLDALRAHLGPKGNVQITDGEVTLLPADDLIAILRHARGIGLLPMVMSHGDSFRRRPGLLERLVLEGGLREVSIHVDNTQRGRKGYKQATSEGELMPLRAELADLVRRARKATGVRLRVATTMTIHAGNLGEVPAVISFCFANRDVFGFISFQPVAMVGRTDEGLEGVDVDALWNRVGEALAPHGYAGGRTSLFRYGHPDCTRMEPFAVYQRRGEPARLLPVLREGSPADREILDGYFAHGLGGLNFRDDTLLERVCRTLGAGIKAPGWWAGPVRRWAAGRARELGTTLPRTGVDLVTARAKIDSFVVVSHHFMSPAELATPLGQERAGACVFRLPVNGEMVAMCQANAGGARDTLYESLGRRDGTRPPSDRPEPALA